MTTKTFTHAMVLQQIKLARLHQAFANLAQSAELNEFINF